MKKILFSIVISFFYLIIYSQQKYIENLDENLNLEIIEQVSGDLNNDGIDERVIVYNTNRMTDFGIEREIHIYRMKNDNWELWIKTTKGLRKSEEFGMVGDFGIEVKNKTLVIYHSGGGNWKWVETHKYRFQDDSFYLIGVTIQYGTLCNYWQNLDYNLVTGDIHYKKEFEICNENGEWVKSKFESENFNNKPIKLPNLLNIEIGKNKIITPKLRAEMYY